MHRGEKPAPPATTRTTHPLHPQAKCSCLCPCTTATADGRACRRRRDGCHAAPPPPNPDAAELESLIAALDPQLRGDLAEHILGTLDADHVRAIVRRVLGDAA